MTLTQLSVFLENKPGRLQHILKCLADNEINILTNTIAESKDFGILRLIVDKPEKAHAVLRQEKVTCSKTEVLAVALDDVPGTLYRTLDAFAKRNINIEYVYTFTGRHESKPIIIFRFDNLEEAKTALKEEGYTVLSRAEIQES